MIPQADQSLFAARVGRPLFQALTAGRPVQTQDIRKMIVCQRVAPKRPSKDRHTDTATVVQDT